MKRTICVLLVSLLAAAPAAAKHENRKHSKKHSQAHDRDRDDLDVAHRVNRYFGPRDVQIVREYYVPRQRSLPPGLVKKFYRSGRLPPGWAKKMEPLPVSVERQLVPLPPTYRRGYIDGAIVVYSPRTQVMIDVVILDK